MDKVDFNDLRNFVESNYGNNQCTSIEIEKINNPLVIKYINRKKHFRYTKKISVDIDDDELKCFNQKCMLFRLSSNNKTNIDIQICRFNDMVNLLNPALEILNMFNLKKNHFRIDFENKCIIVNHRLKIILTYVDYYNCNIEIKYFERNAILGIDRLIIYTGKQKNRKRIKIDHLFQFSLKHDTIDMNNSEYCC